MITGIGLEERCLEYCTLYLQDSSQIELLKELMDLQKDMVVMLLSMLEGNFKSTNLHFKKLACCF